MMTARECSSRLAALLRNERAAFAEFLLALADFDRRRAWVELGHASLFSYLHRELGLSLGAAQYRKTAAELVQRFPEVIEPLRDGRLCMTTVCEVAKVLTDENRGEVLPRFFGLSRREAAAVAAEIAPHEAPPRRTIVTAIWSAPAAPKATAVAAPAVPALDLAQLPFHPGEVQPDRAAPAPPACVSPPPRDEVVPLTADLRRLHLTVSKELLAKVDAARAALSHSHPGATIEEILEVGLDLVLERDAKRKGIVNKPQKKIRAARRDTVPARVRRAVWKRDGGKCQWPVVSGGICGSTVRVQLHHRKSRARGGPHTVENLVCACAFHNDLAARHDLGDAWMDRFTGGRGNAPRATGAP